MKTKFTTVKNTIIFFFTIEQTDSKWTKYCNIKALYKTHGVYLYKKSNYFQCGCINKWRSGDFSIETRLYTFRSFCFLKPSQEKVVLYFLYEVISKLICMNVENSYNCLTKMSMRGDFKTRLVFLEAKAKASKGIQPGLYWKITWSSPINTFHWCTNILYWFCKMLWYCIILFILNQFSQLWIKEKNNNNFTSLNILYSSML